MLSPTGADQRTIPQETQSSSTRLLPEVPGIAVKPEVTFSENHYRSPTFHSWFEMLEAPRTSRPSEVTLSEDQYTSSTYHRWFERHTGLSLDEAIALGLAEREHASA
jgi:methylphosphotriester-DNA--protein-cysteine methyltransferase